MYTLQPLMVVTPPGPQIYGGKDGHGAARLVAEHGGGCSQMLCDCILTTLADWLPDKAHIGDAREILPDRQPVPLRDLLDGLLQCLSSVPMFTDV